MTEGDSGTATSRRDASARLEVPDSSFTVFRPCRAGDEPALGDLFYRSFGGRVTEDHWRWKLRGQPSSVDNAWLATCAGQPIFHYAGIPRRFSLGQKEVAAMLAVDAMTAPEFRRRGLLTRAVPEIHDNWRQRGVAFVLGLPNDQWGSRARVLGWQPLFSLQWLIRPLRPEALLASRLTLPFLKRFSAAGAAWNNFLQGRLHRDATVRVERVASAGENFDRLWEFCKADANLSTVRDRAWVDWRYLASPSRKYVVCLARRADEPVGYCAYYLAESGNRTSAVLAEVLAARSDESVRDSLLYALIETLLATKAETLATLAVPGTAHFNWLRSVGFLPRRAFSVELIPLAAGLPMDAMRNADNWNLCGADFDVV
ncbi:MAG TPA: GNAT family N-acetyltransferase [Steroidobacteraceae bacterium]|nr:GNAT family N-acetyltransferase [Steroidobacteraceae bacterium]